MLLYDRALARERHASAEMIHAVAMGYSGCKSKDGAKALNRAIEELTEN